VNARGAKIPPGSLPDIVGLAVTVDLHLWRRNAVLSILAGTVVYILLVSTLSAG
jgi:branched-subunit amino acid transport protein AzlD